MWSSHSRHLTLAGQFLVLQLAVVAVVLGIVAAISVRQSTATFTAERGSQMRSVAEYLANIEVVRTQVGERGAARALAPSIDRALRLSGATTVSVADPEGTVVSSSDPALIDAAAELEDSRVAEGRGWTGDVERDDRRILAAHAPILADDGTLVGFTIAEERYPSTWDRLTDAASDLIVFLGVGATLGVVGSWLVAGVVRRRTRGLGSREIAELADQREALLHSIREGVVAVDVDRRVTLLNDGARMLLGLDDEATGRTVDDLNLAPHVVDLLLGEGEARDAVALVGDRVIVFNRRRASSRGRGIGSVTTMRDRTEVVSVQGQLGANLSITDTLRAQTHEFSNQLHTISGLVQLGEYDEVLSLVGRISAERDRIAGSVTSKIADPALAALLIAKSSVAAEAGVALHLTDGSLLPTLDAAMSADLTTIVGNLVDNAIDASRGTADADVAVDLRVVGETVVLEVRDTGPGVPPELQEAIFVRGFSTKPDVLGGRGIGLPLVQLICRQRGGHVTISRDSGAVFRVELPWSAA